ncbi:hypothetical protein BH11MYX2_BH11MYX2_32550 [soil metagenome]
MRTISSSLVVALLLPTTTAHALCVVPEQHPVVVNDGVHAPADGGLVVATTNKHTGTGTEGEAWQPTWVFVHGAKTQKPTLVALAPGLAVYRLPAGTTDADLSDGTNVRAHVVAGDASYKALAAPLVQTVSHLTARSIRGSTGATTVTIKGDVPTTAIAMLILDAKTKKAFSYGLVQPASGPVLAVYAQGRCSALPNGTVAPRVGQRVILQWVDSLGRLSAASKSIAIRKG